MSRWIKINSKLLKRKVRRLAQKYFPEQYGSYSVASFSLRKRVVIIDWNSEEGKKMLARSQHSEPFFALAHLYQPQINPFFCSVAAMVTTLNALRLDKGKVPNQSGFDFEAPTGEKIHYKLYSQLTLFNPKTEKVKRKVDIAPSMLPKDYPLPEEDYDPGLNLHEVEKILNIHGAETSLVYAKDPLEKALPYLRETIKSLMKTSDKIMIANFHGKVMGLTAKGHYSTIGAYDEESDSVLVLDTAAHKHPWYWVPLKHLYHGMHTEAAKDLFRGHIIVWDK